MRNVVLVCWMMLGLRLSAGALYDPNLIEELRIRGGLPNFFHQIEAGERVRVAYLGGSITWANGWRVKSFDWLSERYPEVEFEMINAAVSGTGADFGLCRLQAFVIAHKPDLVFVEYRVNGGGRYPEEAFEGVVRRIFEATPDTDICFVYTVGDWMLSDLSAGKQFYYGIMMEEIANHYNIPSIDFGVEVVRLLEANRLAVNVETRPDNKIWFTKDNCHPTDEGHEVYNQIISRSLIRLQESQQAAVSRRELPPRLYPNDYLKTGFLPMSGASTSGGWQIVDGESDLIYRSDFHRTRSMLGDAIKCSDVGESLTVEWDGRYFAMTYLVQGADVEVEVSVDGKPPETFQLEESEGSILHARHFYLEAQSRGQHRAQLTTAKLGKGATLYLGQCMQLGN